MLDLLTLPYSRVRWSALLRQMFAHYEERQVPLELEAPSGGIAARMIQLGTVTVTGAEGGDPKSLAVIEIEAADVVNLMRNRVGLRQTAARLLSPGTADGLLVITTQPGMQPWRFTFISREVQLNEHGQIVRTETAPRRFTYLLGPEESCRTAADRFMLLASRRPATNLTHVLEAFSVEKLNKEFFDTYRDHYRTFCDHLLDTDAPAAVFGLTLDGLEGKTRDRALKPVRDFVKKLLGRLVFLHFLQKKGWLGCDPARDDWHGGPPDFLRRLFDSAPPSQKNRFHSRRLVPLFFATLNNPSRSGDLFAVTGTRVPYLNGGLFEPDFTGVERLDFPAPLFAALLEFFGQYHFTIDENDPEDHEIGIDPEMLGHIFENLLEDNKDKGAYYTPKAVVQYMCQQSLIHALTGQFPGDADARGEIEKLIRTKEPIDARDSRSWLTRHATGLSTRLDELRICDPAIGSGAFPIGLLQEIYWTQLTLNPALDRAAAKRSIIQRSIHGVDLDAGAVEIARLRFWLALIVEESAPVPLPNLDYQIMQGNSLLESFEGERLDDLAEPVRRVGRQRLGSDHMELDLDGGGTPGELSVTILSPAQCLLAPLLSQYFACHEPEEKSLLRAAIDKAVFGSIDLRLDLRRHELTTALHDRDQDLRRKRRINKDYHPSAAEQKKHDAMRAELTALEGKSTRLHSLLADPRAERPFFLWHLWFRHILAAPPDGNGGFDIVIANPPYVQITPERFSADEIKALKKFAAFSYKADLYELFLEHALTLVSSGGIVCYITPIAWLGLQNSEPLRRLIFANGTITEVCVWGEDVFEHAIVSTHSTFILKQPSSQPIRIICGTSVQELSVEAVKTAPFHRIEFSSNDVQRTLIAKLRATSKPLSEFCEVSQGITPYDKYSGQSAEVIKERAYHAKLQINPTYGQWLNGRDVLRYKMSWSGEWLSYGDWLGAPREAKFFTAEKLLCREVPGSGKRIQAAYHVGTIYCGHSISPVIAKANSRVGLKVILAVLNSRVPSWYARLCCANFAKDIFPKLNPSDIKEIPIPAVNPADQAALSALVDRILAAKRAGDEAAVGPLEAEIDARVYQLYCLTPEEIRLIEGTA